MRKLILFIFLACLMAITIGHRAFFADQAPKPAAASVKIWPSIIPADCPFKKSKDLAGIAFTGRHREYDDADTWYPSWASDGNLYSPFTDGRVGTISSGSGGAKATTGQAKILGEDPLNLQVIPLGVHAASPEPYGGRYPCGSLVYNGIWYYGTYCLDQKQFNWDILGPFVGFRISRDLGETWMDTPCTPANPLFKESGKGGAKVKIGAPHFVDFGKNMEHSPDGKAYLVGHGAARPEANLSWISGDQVYLVRVKPAPETINDFSKYEFFAGHDAKGASLWTNDFSKIKPLVEWLDRVGVVTMTYDAPLKKYLMCITDGWPTVGPMNTYILESDTLTGPWRIVVFMKYFGEQGYFVNIPSKFIGPDGGTAWLCYSANFTNGWIRTRYESDPPGSRYALCLQEFKLLKPAEEK
jgi:hypothetical protein